MVRFFGLMPTTEVEKEVTYKDSHGRSILIQAGPNGWTIIYADHSSEYGDNEATTEENFKIAYDTCIKSIGEIYETSDITMTCTISE